MNTENDKLILGLEALLQDSKVANAKLEYSYEIDRIKRRITELESENKLIKEILKVVYIKLTTNENM